jgi:DNA-binding response OmpR family regulator
MPKKVLVVEDEKDSRDFLATFLKMEGYAVVTASDGLEGIEKVETDCPDIIISDISMPNLDGIDMVRTLRKSPKYQAIPVILLTALDSENLILGVNAGANEAMRKPINPDTLVKNIKDWLNKPGVLN